MTEVRSFHVKDLAYTANGALLVGLAACYAFGTAWFMVVYARTQGPVGLMTALRWCVFPFVLSDLLKGGYGTAELSR